MKKEFLLILLTLILMISTANAADNAYVDGIYKGKYSFVEVQVTIKNGDMSDIQILHHGGGGKKYADMVAPLVDEIIRKQSIDVDTITGATVSSVNLRNAVENALEKAIKK